VVPIALPSQPDAPTRVTHTQTSITLQWAPPASDGDSEITSYILYAKADFETSYSQIYAGLSLQYQATNLLTGFEYQFKVRAVNALGQSEASAASTAILTALKPSSPTGLTLTARSASQVSFEWKAPEDKGGIELSGFNIYMAEGSGTYELVGSTPSSLNPTVTWHTHEDALIAAAWYKFKVSAVNFVGESEITEGIEVIAADVPEAPANPPTATLIT
jgi:titin